jgi:hypothetical protein
MTAANYSGPEGAQTTGSTDTGSAEAEASRSQSSAEYSGTNPSPESQPQSPSTEPSGQQRDDGPQGESAKHWNRVANSKDAELKKYTPLKAAVDSLGAEAAMGHLTRFNRLMSDPAFAEAVSAFETTGKFAPAAAPSSGYDDAAEDEYLSPEEKQLRDLSQEMQGLKKTLLNRDAQTAKSGLTSAFVDVYRGFGLVQEQVERIGPQLETTISQYEQTPQGVEALEKMMTNSKSVELLVAGMLEDEEREQAYLHKHETRTAARAEEQGRFATDARPSVQTSGKEPTSAGLSVRESMRAAAGELGFDLGRPLISQ